MKETISVLGTNLKYISREDVSPLMEEYLNTDMLHTMCVVTKEMLVYAEEHPEYRESLEEMDLHAVIDKDIFTAAGITEESLLKTAEDWEIWNLFVETAAKEKKTCFLLAQSEEELSELESTLKAQYPDLTVAGSYAAERAGGEPEIIVNEINGILPDVVLSAMEQPYQELFIHEQKQKMGTKVWFGFRQVTGRGRIAGDNWLSRLIDKTVFNRKVQQYNSMCEEEQEE